MKIKHFFIILGISVMLGCYLILFWAMATSLPSGDVLISFNNYGEHKLELILFLIALPVIFYSMNWVLENIAHEDRKI